MHRLCLTDAADIAMVDEALAAVERDAVETIQCLTEHAHPGQCKDAAKRLVRVVELRAAVRGALNDG